MPYLHFKAYKIIIKGAELKIKVFSLKKKKKKKKRQRKERQEKKQPKNFELVSLSAQITQDFGHIRQKKNMSGYLKDDANLLTYSEM